MFDYDEYVKQIPVTLTSSEMAELHAINDKYYDRRLKEISGEKTGLLVLTVCCGLLATLGCMIGQDTGKLVCVGVGGLAEAIGVMVISKYQKVVEKKTDADELREINSLNDRILGRANAPEP